MRAAPDSEQLFAAEQIAIGATNALEASRVSLRGYRERPLLGRALDALTGNGRCHAAAIASDLRATQQATLDAVRWVMDEETRTQGCLMRVADAVRRLDAELGALDGIIPALRAAVHSLDERLSSLTGVVDREVELRRLKEAFIGGRFQTGSGPLLRSAFFLAHVDRLFTIDAPAARQKERDAARDLVREHLANAGWTIAPPGHLLFSAVSEVHAEKLLLTAASVEGTTSPFTGALADLLTQRLANVSSTEKDAARVLKTAHYRHASQPNTPDELLFPHQLAAHVAHELIRI